jgi:pyridoxal phosphate-dependent aminotransferase EpsN
MVTAVADRKRHAPTRASEIAERIYLSPPHMSGAEQEFIREAFDTNWVAPIGPHVDAFEREFAAYTGSRHAVAVSSGTAALHLSLILAGVSRGDEVLVSSFTFAASANPIVYLGARPVFIDSERESWNIDPALLSKAIEQRARTANLPKAVIVAHLYGQSANMRPIVDVCREHGVALIEDAAEALGASYHGRAPGSFGLTGIHSFNGNKVITTSGGGMLVTDDERTAGHARKLATQAREPEAHYEHREIGYNYRLSNVLAGIGRAQLQVIEERVAARRRNFDLYRNALGDLPGIAFQDEAPWGRHSRWLTCMTVDPREAGVDREALRLALAANNIESRPFWKPLHMQPVFAECEVVGGGVCETLFAHGLCLPSGSSLSDHDRNRVIETIADAVA